MLNKHRGWFIYFYMKKKNLFFKMKHLKICVFFLLTQNTKLKIKRAYLTHNSQLLSAVILQLFQHRGKSNSLSVSLLQLQLPGLGSVRLGSVRLGSLRSLPSGLGWSSENNSFRRRTITWSNSYSYQRMKWMFNYFSFFILKLF